MSAAHLLPPNATPYEQALATTLGRLSAVPVPIDLIKRPEATPGAFLPLIAWEVATDLWPARWPDWRRRQAVARSIALHRVKGTLPGVAGYLSLLGAELIDAALPPQGCFLVRGRTADEKRAFLARFAELRVYLHHASDAADPGAAWLARRKGWLGRRFLRVSTAPARHGRRAAIVDGGVERPVRWSVVAAAADAALPVERVTIPATARPQEGFVGRAFLGGRRAYLSSAGPQSRILTLVVARDATAGALPVIRSDQPALDVLSLTPERVFGRGPGARRAAYCGRSAARFLRGPAPAVHVYDRFYLYDPARVAGGRRLGAGTFLDHSRIGLKPFRAELRVRYPAAARRGTTFLGGSHVGHHHLTRPAGRMREVAQALRVAVAARDRILFTTRCHEPADLVAGIPLDGSFTFGELPIRGNIA